MNENYIQAHHFEESDIILNEGYTMYFNYFSESFNTVNYSQLFDFINSKLGRAITNEVLLSSGTLIGVMAGMTGEPGLLATLSALGIFNVEIKTVSYKSNFLDFVNAVSIYETENGEYSDIEGADVKINYPYTHTPDYYFRNVNLNDENDFNRNYLVKKQLFNSIPVFFGAFYIFDKFRKINNYKQEYITLFKLAYNISSFIFAENVCYPLQYSKSNCLSYCNALLGLNLGHCMLERGQYTNIKYYVYPISSIDNNIHNILFRKSIPNFKNNENNNYVSLCCKQIFHSEFINFDTVNNFSKNLRKDDDSFKEYLFDCTTDNNIYKIGFDNVSEILTEYLNYEKSEESIQKSDYVYNKDMVTIYNNIISTATYIFNLYNEYYLDVKNDKCSIKSSIALNDRYKYYDEMISNIETILQPSKLSSYDIGNLIHINSNLEKDKKYYLFAPFFGNYLEMLNLNVSFLDIYYSNSMAMLQLRYNSIYKIFCKYIDTFIELLNSYDSYIFDNKIKTFNINYKEVYENNLISIEERLFIPNIFSMFIEEQRLRGNFKIEIKPEENNNN